MISSPIQLLQDLVRIPSINPGQAKDPSLAGEARMVAYLTKLFEDAGAQVILSGPSQERPNFIARFSPVDGRPRVLLGPHMDTVDVTGMTIPPFSAELHHGKIWGRGTSDTKGPMASMIAGLLDHRAKLAAAPIAVDFVAFADEELYQSGSIHFAKHHAHDYQFAFVGEPTSLDFVHCSKGACHLNLIAKGKSAHASQPQNGVNAIAKLAAAVTAIDQDFIPRLENDYLDPVLGPTTLNIGTISGGIQTNIIPDHAICTLDCRFTPACAEAGGPLPALREFLKLRAPDLELKRIAENPPMYTTPDHPILDKIRKSHPESGLTGAPWFSDAAHLAAAGLSAVCIGPGSIDQAHTEDEFISVSDFEAGVDFFSRLVNSLIS